MSALEQIQELRARMGQSIIGQKDVIERILIGLLANGNLLVEGLPGLAKTRAIKSLAKNLEADFSRIRRAGPGVSRSSTSSRPPSGSPGR